MPLDDWSDDPPSGPWPKWFSGCIVPILIAAYAVSVLITREGTLIGRRGRLTLHGTEATIYGALLLGLACFLHTHFFWGNTDSLAPYSVLGKTLGLVIFAVGAAVLIFRIVVLT